MGTISRQRTTEFFTPEEILDRRRALGLPAYQREWKRTWRAFTGRASQARRRCGF